jgi:glycosyltransferase involved in cell wall biosynthesis
MPGCREIVINGINGILIRPMDHVELAKSIAYLINNPENRKKMGAAGRKLVETQFSEDLVVGQVLKLYQLFPDGRF